MRMDIRTILVDFDSPHSIRQTLATIRRRQREFKKKALGLKEYANSPSNNEIFDACSEILTSDISGLFPAPEGQRDFYVYAHLDPTMPIVIGKHKPVLAFAATLGMTHTPFYIGKGCGGRMEVKDRNETHRKVLQKLKTRGIAHHVFAVKDGLLETEALQLEAKLIDILGLIAYGGYLTNLDECQSKRLRRNLYKKAFAKIHASAWIEFAQDAVGVA